MSHCTPHATCTPHTTCTWGAPAACRTWAIGSEEMKL